MNALTMDIIRVVWGGLHKRLRPICDIESHLVCDTCKQSIDSVEGAWVEWIRGVEGSMRLVHHRDVTGTAEQPDGCCLPESTPRMQDHHLHRFMADDGPALLAGLGHEGSRRITNLLYGSSR